VTDRLIKLGAQAVIVPTMDVFGWGVRQHELHALIAPVRAAEYGIPIFRVASSGISQLVEESGRVVAKASCPGEGEIISGTLKLGQKGSLPLDRWLTPVAVAVSAGLIVWSFLASIRGRRSEAGRGSIIPSAPEAGIAHLT
jgi:apolipoprotein N-acyltransferase